MPGDLMTRCEMTGDLVAALFAGDAMLALPLREEDSWLPRLDEVPPPPPSARNHYIRISLTIAGDRLDKAWIRLTRFARGA